MGSVKIANLKITLCAEREMAITFVCNWENGRRVFVWQCVPGRHYGAQRRALPAFLVPATISKKIKIISKLVKIISEIVRIIL